MNSHSIKRICALTLTATLALSMSANALFGSKKQEPTQPEEGAPIAQELEITTYRGIPYQAQFLATDHEGDDLTFAVVDAPKKGSVTVDGANFTYTPEAGAAGADSFTYAATDSAGHVSQSATVTVTIEKARSGVTYADTEDSSAAAAAQYLAEAGIFTGTQIGQQYYFEPSRTVSRSEFLAMVLETAGEEVTSVTMTGFCDDAAIPTWAKAYAAAGVAEGLVLGSATDQGMAFRASEPITLSEAATVLNRALDLEDVDLSVWYADQTAAPSWAAQAVGNLEAVNVLAAGSFAPSAVEAPITRADAALMLCAAGTLMEGKTSGGLLDWLH